MRRPAVNAVVSASLRALPLARASPTSKLPLHSSRMRGCSRRSKACCSAASRTVATAARGAVLVSGPAAICNWSPVVESLPLTVWPAGSTTLSSVSLRMLFTADHGMVTSPRNSLLMVSVAPSFFTMAPVMVSPLVSTTWSAARAGKESSRKGAEIADQSICHGNTIQRQRPSSESRWHFLYFFPLPHQQGSLRPNLGSARSNGSSSTTSKPSRQTS